MKKAEEIVRQDSCWNKAVGQERLFILLARDAAAPTAVRAWASKRVELGLNQPDDAQIKEAMDCANLMESERKHLRSELEKMKG